MRSTSRTETRPRTSSGILWAGISQAGRVIIQFLGLVVLSRLLPPSDFGVVALGSIVINLAVLLRDMGTSVAVIQREQLNESLLDTIFWFNVAIGVILGLVVVLISSPASVVLAEPALQGILTTSAILFPVGGLGAIHQALLERAFRFRALARIELTSSVLGLAGGMLAAWKGAGAYSLVFTTLITVTVSTLLLWVVSPWRPSLRWNSAEFRTLGGFSGNLVGFQFVNYFSRNADTILIGRFLGTESLGSYNMAYKLMLFPVQNLSSVIGRALLPVLSRTQHDHATLRSIYLNAISTIAVITCPLMIGLWVLREPFVLAVLGNDWIAVPAVLAWLAPVGLAQSLVSPVGLLYIACGKTDLMLRAGVLVTSVTVLGMATGLPWGMVGVAAGYATANLLIIGPCVAIPFRLVGLKFRDFLRAVATPLAASVVMGVAIWVILAVWKIDRQAPALQLGVLVILSMALFMSMAVLFLRPAIMQVVSIMKDSIKGMPIIGELARRLYRRYLMQDPAPFTGSGNYWEGRYANDGNSGVGSYGKFAAFKADVLNEFVEKHGVESVMEFGCGDGNQLKLARYPRYTGFDVSRTAVERCTRLFAGDTTKSFALASTYSGERADLVLSLDVVFHLVEDDVFENYMRSLFLSSQRYVIIYSSDYDDDSTSNGRHVKHRKFSTWVLQNCPSWRLLERIPNKYPYHGDNHEGSFADFFVYERVEP